MEETNKSEEYYDFELIPLGYKDEFGDEAFKVVDKEPNVKDNLSLLQELTEKIVNYPDKVTRMTYTGVIKELYEKFDETFNECQDDGIEVLPYLIYVYKKLKDYGIYYDYYKHDIDNGNAWFVIPEKYKQISYPEKIKYELSPTDKGLHKIVKDFTSDDDLKIVLTGVNFDKNGVQATDGHALIMLSGKPKNHTMGVYCIDKQCLKLAGGKEVNATFPNYLNVLPFSYGYKFEIDVKKLYLFTKVLLDIGYSHTVTKMLYLKFIQEDGEVFEIAFNGDNLLKSAKAMLLVGYEKAEMKFNHPHKGVSLRSFNDEVEIFIMPMFITANNNYSRMSREEDDEANIEEAKSKRIYFNPSNNSIENSGISDESKIEDLNNQLENAVGFAEKSNIISLINDIKRSESQKEAQTDKSYFEELLEGIKISLKFADKGEKAYFKEMKESIEISLKYL